MITIIRRVTLRRLKTENAELARRAGNAEQAASNLRQRAAEATRDWEAASRELTALEDDILTGTLRWRDATADPETGTRWQGLFALHILGQELKQIREAGLWTRREDFIALMTGIEPSGPETEAERAA